MRPRITLRGRKISVDTTMEAMTTYGPVINVSVSLDLAERLDLHELHGKVNYYAPALTFRLCGSTQNAISSVVACHPVVESPSLTASRSRRQYGKALRRRSLLTSLARRGRAVSPQTAVPSKHWPMLDCRDGCAWTVPGSLLFFIFEDQIGGGRSVLTKLPSVSRQSIRSPFISVDWARRCTPTRKLRCPRSPRASLASTATDTQLIATRSRARLDVFSLFRTTRSCSMRRELLVFILRASFMEP
jgi:hypothetical protein